MNVFRSSSILFANCNGPKKVMPASTEPTTTKHFWDKIASAGYTSEETRGVIAIAPVLRCGVRVPSSGHSVVGTSLIPKSSHGGTDHHRAKNIPFPWV